MNEKETTSYNKGYENKPELWKGLDSYGCRYVTVDWDGIIMAHRYKPECYEFHWGYRETRMKSVPTTHPLAKIALQRVLDYGWTESLIEKPQMGIGFCKPDYNDKYYHPIYDPINHSLIFSFRIWEDCDLDYKLYRDGCVFPASKYCKWVIEEQKNTFILQAALAVDGLASSRQIFRGHYCYFIFYTYITATEQWDIQILATSNRYRPGVVLFRSREKAQEALTVVLPTGKTLQDYLEGN
jgi:hypothetical protein